MKMKFINTNKLNELHLAFEKAFANCGCDNKDFQQFVENSKDKGIDVCFDTEGVRGLLESICNEDYDYLLECDDKDFKLFSSDYLKRINFFQRLLGAETDISIDDIKEERENLNQNELK